MLEVKISKTCDNCKFRKVRCSGSRYPNRIACTNCTKRKTGCNFSLNKRRTKTVDDASNDLHLVPTWPHETRPTEAPTTMGFDPQSAQDQAEQTHNQADWLSMMSDCTQASAPGLPMSNMVYMDEMLERKEIRGMVFHSCLIPKSEKQSISSSSLSLFSDSDIRSISEKLSNASFGDLIESFSDSINKRLHRKANMSYPKVTFKTQSEQLQLSLDQQTGYVGAYFDHMHPIFPFLVRKDFELQVLGQQSQHLLEQVNPFSVLYNAVLAIGSQYSGSGAFEPGKGQSWHLFQGALDRLQELIGSKPCLESVQALLAMFCYAMTHCGGQIAETLLSEAARMAQFVRLNRGSASLTDGAHQRTFWVIYSLEKLSCFCQGRTSAIPDNDIGCHIPHIPEAVFEGFNWFLSSVRFGRLISKAQDSLFSVSATLKSRDEFRRDIEATSTQLEAWRQSIPLSFRPGERFARAHFTSPTSVMAALRTHLTYHNFVMVLNRLDLQIAGPDVGPFRHNALETFMSSARRVIELTGHLEVEPYAPSVLLTVFPLSAFLSLFHLVIDNPQHFETRDNLTFLDVAAGYFRRLEYVMKQEFPFSIFPKLAAVAQEFVRKLPQKSVTSPIADIEALSLPRDQAAQGARQEIQIFSGPTPTPAQIGSQILPPGEQTDSGVASSRSNGIAEFEPLPPAVEGYEYRPDATLFTPDNGAIDFFGDLLDETYNSLYGVDWQ